MILPHLEHIREAFKKKKKKVEKFQLRGGG